MDPPPRDENAEDLEGASPTAGEVWDEFLNSPAVQHVVSQLPDLYEKHAATSRWAMGRVLIFAIALVIATATAVTLLTWFGKMSSDAAAFLFGSLVGGGFAFLRLFFPGRTT